MSRPMKQSGVDWLGDIPTDWKVYPVLYAFSKICTKNTNGAVTNALKFYNGTIVRKTNFDAESDDYVADTITNYTVVNPDTVMINGLNLNYDLKSLRVGLVKETGVITSAYLALCPDGSRVVPRYATYLFKGYEAKMAFHNMGAGIRKTLGFKEFRRQPVIIPPLDEQQRIANFLDDKCARIDSVIEKTRASIDEYKKLKQAVITRAVTRGIRPARPTKFSGVDWLGEIPADWEVISIGRLFSFIGGYAFSSEKFCGQTNHQVVRIGNIKDDCLLLEEKAVFIDDDYAKTAQAFIIKPDDILFTMTGTKGKKDYFYTLLVKEKDIKSVNLYINQRVGCFRKNKDCDMRYYNHLLKVPKLKEYVFLFETGTANQGNLGISTIRKTRILFPPLDEQKEIAAYLDEKTAAIDSLIAKKNQLASELERLKKSLIFEYVTGKKELAQ